MTPLAWARLGIVAALVGALFLSCHERDQALIAKGRAEEQLKAITQKTVRDSMAGEVAAATVTADTIVLTKWITKRDTLRTTLRLTDTVRVLAYIAVQDSTIHACREAVGSLTTLCQRKDSLIADYRAQLAIRVSAPPRASFSQRVLWGLGGIALGVAADRIVH